MIERYFHAYELFTVRDTDGMQWRIDQCKVCAALVSDRTAHIAWHAEGGDDDPA